MLDIRKIVMTSAAGALLALGVAACENQHPDTVPGSAQLMESGNKDVVFTAPERGMAYVYDKNGNHLIWSGEVSKGRQIKLDPNKNEVTVDGSVVSKGFVQPFHEDQIWFQPHRSMGLVNTDADRAQPASTSEQTTTTVPPQGGTYEKSTTTTYRQNND